MLFFTVLKLKIQSDEKKGMKNRNPETTHNFKPLNIIF